MTILNIFNTLMGFENADSIRLNDGAYTWDVYNLYDATRNGDEERRINGDTPDDRTYSLQSDGIYLVDEDGYLGTVPVYKFEMAA